MAAKKMRVADSEVSIESTKSYEVLHDHLQTRAETKASVVTAYQEAMERNGANSFPPVLIFELPDARRVLADGFHRDAAIKRLPRPHCNTIRAIVRKGTMQEAILAGLQANLDIVDRRTLTKEDRMHAVKVMLRDPEFNSWSDRGIGTWCGQPMQTVAKARLSLRDSEGIEIPVRVRCIDKAGRPLDHTTLYKRLWEGRPKIMCFSQGKNQASINGVRVKLPPSDEEASETLDQILREQESWKTCMANRSNFQTRLVFRGINSCSVPKDVFTAGGLFVGTTSVTMCPSGDIQEFFAAAFLALCIAKVVPSLNRAIVVGYVGGNRNISSVLRTVASLGVEVMTPDEFIAEFAPKSDAAPLPGDPQQPVGDGID